VYATTGQINSSHTRNYCALLPFHPRRNTPKGDQHCHMDQIDRNVLLQLFIEELPGCAVILLDPNGNILSWNAGAQAILGYAAHEIVGQHFSVLHPKADIAAAVPSAALSAAVAHGRHQETSRRITKDGTVIEVASVLLPLYDAQKKLVGFGNMTGAGGGARPSAVTAKLHALPKAIRHAPKILVVDDDDGVRDVAMRQLKSLGYTVLMATNGPEALEMLHRNPDIDLLFTDVVMPGGLNGREVAEQARRIIPGLKVLFTSGYFEGALVRDGALESSVRLLVKPYRKNELAETMAEVLAVA
jgi:PAS domain S-box-containing protein